MWVAQKFIRSNNGLHLKKMKNILILVSFLFFSISAKAQSQKAKVKFMADVFNDFKNNRLAKISAQFVDSFFLDVLVTHSKELEEESTKNISREKIHQQGSMAKEQFTESLAAAYYLFTFKKTRDKLEKVNPSMAIYDEREKPINAFGMKYSFKLDGLMAEMEIPIVAFDSSRKRFVIMAPRVRKYLGPAENDNLMAELKEEKISEDLSGTDHVQMPPRMPKREGDSLIRRSMGIENSATMSPPVFSKTNLSEDDKNSHDEVFQFPDTMPEFPEGTDSMLRFLAKNIEYPHLALESEISGTVYATFVVGKDGTIEDISIARGIGGGCDQEAIRVIKIMPKWTPGMQGGKVVRTQFRLPIRFVMQ